MNVNEAIAAVKANPAYTTMPWGLVENDLVDPKGTQLARFGTEDDAGHAHTCVVAVPVLIAEVERLQAVVEAVMVAVESAALPPLPLGSHYLALVERANDIGEAQRKALTAIRRALGLEVGNG